MTRRTNIAVKGPAPDLSGLPNIARALAGGGLGSDDNRGFEYGLSLLLAGIEQRIAVAMRDGAKPE